MPLVTAQPVTSGNLKVELLASGALALTAVGLSLSRSRSLSLSLTLTLTLSLTLTLTLTRACHPRRAAATL